MRVVRWFVSALVIVFLLTHLSDVVALFKWVATVKLR